MGAGLCSCQRCRLDGSAAGRCPSIAKGYYYNAPCDRVPIARLQIIPLVCRAVDTAQVDTICDHERHGGDVAGVPLSIWSIVGWCHGARSGRCGVKSSSHRRDRT